MDWVGKGRKDRVEGKGEVGMVIARNAGVREVKERQKGLWTMKRREARWVAERELGSAV